MEKTKRCSSCKLNRRIELFQKPMSTLLFNTCENCRLKKKNNYHRQKLKRTSKDLRTLPSELASLPSRAVASSTSMNVGLAPFSVIRYESSNWSSCRKNGGFSQASPTSTLKADAQFLGFPSSQWIDAPSSADSVCPVFVAKALFHYTLCNVHSC